MWELWLSILEFQKFSLVAPAMQLPLSTARSGAWCLPIATGNMSNMPKLVWHISKNAYRQKSFKCAKNVPIFGYMPSAKILQRSNSKYARFVFSGQKYTNPVALLGVTNLFVQINIRAAEAFATQNGLLGSRWVSRRLEGPLGLHLRDAWLGVGNVVASRAPRVRSATPETQVSFRRRPSFFLTCYV